LKKPSKLTVQIGTSATTALVYPATVDSIERTLILGHGAGAGQESAFMVGFAQALSALGVDVVTFNFLYTEQRRRIPDRPQVLEACFRAVIHSVRSEAGTGRQALVIGGKSMGGRIATQVAASDRDLPVDGIVLLGYPLHPPGRPNERRDKHLPSVERPMLFVQGTRDSFGTPLELAPVLDQLSPRPTVHIVDGGDHSFKLTRRDPAAQAEVYRAVQKTIVAWMKSITSCR
jgi:predicted alpha/beta-hydrolase family hydrolase